MTEVTSKTEVVPRALAKERGDVFYYTGVPCVRGHLSVRYVSIRMCRECRRELERAAIAKNSDNKRVNARAAYWRDPEKQRKRTKLWRQLNPERIRLTGEAWRAEHAEYLRECWRKWRLEHPDSVVVQAQRRRARKLAAGGSFTVQDVERIFEAQGRRCAYCRVKLSWKTKQIDHIVALSRGGHNGPTNLQITCKPCNNRKRAKHPAAFARELGLLI